MRVNTLLRHLARYDGDNETGMVLVRTADGRDLSVTRVKVEPGSDDVLLFVAQPVEE